MLNSLVKLTRKRKCVGRGGDHGGTSCRGGKGQTARSGGGVSPQFEGGQTPLTRRLPKRGFNNKRFAIRYTVINLGSVQSLFEKDAIVTKEELVRVGLIKNTRECVKLLANAAVEHALTIHVQACSATAQLLLEKVGGKVIISER